MELVYLYIKDYKGIFHDVGINFSSNYFVSYKDNYLKMEKNKDTIKNYYGKNINSVTMFLGKNGVGKSTLLDILGMHYYDRRDDAFDFSKGKGLIKKEKISYFLMYYLYDDYFGFEFLDDEFIEDQKSKIKNLNVSNAKENVVIYRKPMGRIFKYKGNGEFEYVSGKFLNYGKKVMKYVYITEDKYNYRLRNNNIDESSLGGYLFDRKYYKDNIYYKNLYKYLIKMKSLDKKYFSDEEFKIENIANINSNFDVDDKINEYFNNKKKEIDRIFGREPYTELYFSKLKNKKSNGVKKRFNNKKEEFIEYFYIGCIEYYFFKVFAVTAYYDQFQIDISKPIADINQIKKDLESLNEKEREEILDGHFEKKSFQLEYSIFRYIISINKKSDEDFNFDKILDYIFNRLETEDISKDRKYINDFVKLIKKFPEEYFVDREKIHIDLDKENAEVLEFLELYDIYGYLSNAHVNINLLWDIIRIKPPYLSEGQRVFINIISTAISELESLNEGDNLILLIDEPDRSIHPELARRFLDSLLNEINMISGVTVQIVLSSHSPFIVTDVLPESVYTISMSDDKDNKIRTVEPTKHGTFATNIYSLLMDTFMIKNTFGEYSYQKIKEVIDKLKDKESIKVSINEDELENIDKFIDKISEKYLRKKLRQMYIEKVSSDGKSKTGKDLKSEIEYILGSNDSYEEKIKNIEKLVSKK